MEKMKPKTGGINPFLSSKMLAPDIDDDVQLQMHEDLDAQLPHALLRVGVLLPPQEGQALEAG